MFDYQSLILNFDNIQFERFLSSQIIPESIRPLIDGGTEGFKGNSRIICPTQTACLECSLDLYPPQGFKLIFDLKVDN